MPMRILRIAAIAANTIAVAALVLLVIVTVVDVAGRYLFNKPLLGAVEITECLLVFLGFGALAYTELRNGHINVDFFLTGLSARIRALLESGGALLGMTLWGLIGWRTAVHAGRVWTAEEVSSNLAIPTYPFYLFVAIASGLFAVLLLARAARTLRAGIG